MSPPRRKPSTSRKPRASSAAAAGSDLRSLVNQIQALQGRRASTSKASVAELARLRRLLLAALDVNDASEPEDEWEESRWGSGGTWDLDDGDDEESEDEREVGGPDDWGFRSDWSRFTPQRPIRVEAGLAARSRRGAIGGTWWSKRFVAAIEATLAGGRLSKGRSYARQGQVIDLEIGPGQVAARVQGTRKTPYRVRIAMPAARDEQWTRIIDALATQAGYAARLLAGELPHEIEDVFAEAGVALFPSPGSRLATDCSCPDWANPCKHVAAVCYLVAEAFDVDPFLLLTLRGHTRENLLAELRARRGGNGDAALPAGEPPPPVPDLADCLLGFWKAGPELAEVHCLPRASGVAGAVLRQLPRGVVEVRGRDVADVLEPAYATLAGAAETRAFGSDRPT
jgi:uncharacterized Zn finger protein